MMVMPVQSRCQKKQQKGGMAGEEVGDGAEGQTRHGPAQEDIPWPQGERCVGIPFGDKEWRVGKVREMQALHITTADVIDEPRKTTCWTADAYIALNPDEICSLMMIIMKTNR